MKNNMLQRKIGTLFIIIVWGAFSLVSGQYYYFDAASTTNYPYQQWCSEQLLVKATTQSHLTWALAWLFRVQFDPTHFSYFTGTVPANLQTNLFIANTSMFFSYTNSTLHPKWVDSGVNTILHIDRSSTLMPFLGDGTYGTITNLVPKYSTNEYTWTFTIIYNNDTYQTELAYQGQNIINSWYQYAHLTWYFYVYQKPCVDDAVVPSPTLSVPTAGTKKSHLSGIQLSLTDNAGDSNVPYVWTGDLPGSGTWTGNTRSINNQYGINLSTFNIRISGNGTGRYYSWSMFSPAWTLAAVPSLKTRQFRDKNYAITIDPSKLFDYGIEKTITITGNVRDRNNNLSSFSRTINAPVQPSLLSANPAAGASTVATTAPINLSIGDDRAGVNSWSIVITLSGTNGTAYGPYTFTGTSLNLSWLVGSALQPDYAISISNHIAFPSSGTIHVSVYALDMADNTDNISDYTFNTKPSCLDLGCCDSLYLQTGVNPPILYSGSILSVSGGNNPTFTYSGNTGTINCWSPVLGMNIYSGTEDNSWAAIHVNFFGLNNLMFSGYASVKAVLSGHTIYLQSTNIFSLVVKAFPSNRIYNSNPDDNLANTWILKFYDTNMNFITSSLPFTLNAMGTGEAIVNNIPPGTYYAIFKWQSHLASYISWFTLLQFWNQIDFTTGNNLYWAQNFDSQTDNGKKYQTAWDMKNGVGDYDGVINGSDITMIINGTFPQQWVDVFDPRNLNGDTAINASDISVIWANCDKEDIFSVNGGMLIWH